MSGQVLSSFDTSTVGVSAAITVPSCLCVCTSVKTLHGRSASTYVLVGYSDGKIRNFEVSRQESHLIVAGTLAKLAAVATQSTSDLQSRLVFDTNLISSISIAAIGQRQEEWSLP
jgi:hypothetical protein